ncbi:CHAP domain-containing protein [Thermopolyspora sp. NPDC052614]|uniref:CHAP domain-containing protein n=1 Tax=Thermopolyspora sp. NPDC052614 TaxID=3155682 RepID=UPI00343B87DC
MANTDTYNYSDALLKVAESQLGYSEGPGGLTKFGQWYEATHAKEPGYSNAAWCDMFVSWAAMQAGQQEDVGQNAWTVDHAKWFQRHNAWGDKPMPGAVVFFDWGGSKDIDAIDHVGLVKSVVNDHTIKTIEGNISNAVVSKTRTSDKIVGYGYPDAVRKMNQRKVVLANKKNGATTEKAATKAAEAGTAASTETTTSTGASTGTAIEHGSSDIFAPLALSGVLLPAVLIAALAKKPAVRERLTKWIPSLAPIRRDDSD